MERNNVQTGWSGCPFRREADILNEEMSTTRLGEVADAKTLQRILASFTEATGIHAQIVDLQGKVLLRNETRSQVTFCQLVRAGDEGSRKCRESYARAGKYAARFGEPYIFRCPAGLVSWAAPLMVGDAQMGSIICGQVLMWDPEDFFWEEVEEVAHKFGVDPARLQAAAGDLEVISTVRVQAAADLLFTVADNLMRTGLTVLEQRKAITEQQATLAHRMRQKGSGDTERTDSSRYSLRQENEVLVKLKLGDPEAAREAMCSVLSNAIQVGVPGQQCLKARFLELLAQMSRAALEAGAGTSATLEMSAFYLERMNTLRTTEDMCYLMEMALDGYLACLPEAGGGRSSQTVSKAQRYIHRHFNTLQSTKEVAVAVNLSPDYLTRLFKENLGCSLMDYLTRVRVEEAKWLLRETRWRVGDIALKVGYSEASYFVKVFKKVEKVTPCHYRNSTPFEKVAPQHVIWPARWHKAGQKASRTQEVSQQP
jgi:two-component system response regulator YesN